MEDIIKTVNDIAEHYGTEDQAMQTMEECGELIQALNKYLRATGKGQKTDIRMIAAYHGVVEEMADVLIMILQMKHLLDISDEDIESYVKFKVHRSMERIETEDKKKC